LNRQKIVFLTGTRADFGKLKPLMDKVEESQKFDCHIFITGMHTLEKYGNTYKEVMKCNYQNTFVYENQKHSNEQDIILANTINGFSQYVKTLKPDMIIVHGDRVEALGGAIVGSLNNILVSHIEGGEISGTVDELIRHAVSKLSHIHFVANLEAKQRLLQMGEKENTLFIIGSPEIDVMRGSNLPSMNDTKLRYDIPFEKYSVFIFHPVVTELDSLKNQTNEVISSLIESNLNYIVIYPNNDPGSDIIIEQIKKLEKNPNFKIFPSIRFQNFLTLLKNASFIIGNSSVVIREAEVFGTVAINIGTRQQNRSKNDDILNVPSKKIPILNSIKLASAMNIQPKSLFSDEKNSSEQFINILNDSLIWKTLIQKQFVDKLN
tara:strand:- start:3524 stop:4657 length:1134 start_codon:yes stop_codon:yes gene_type:complete